MSTQTKQESIKQMLENEQQKRIDEEDNKLRITIGKSIDQYTEGAITKDDLIDYLIFIIAGAVGVK